MTRCVCGHYHIFECRHCECQKFVADPKFALGSDAETRTRISAQRGFSDLRRGQR